MIEFTPLTEADLPLVRDWRERQHVARWWREPVEQELEERRAADVSGRPSEYYVIRQAS